MYGLNPDTIRDIQSVFENSPEVSEAWIYGSRAMGRERKGSDIDLTLFGKNLSIKTLHRIQHALDELNTPYEFDVSIFKDIDSADVIQHISRAGKVFYRRDAMRDDWRTVKLGELCVIKPPKKEAKEKLSGDEMVSFVPMNNLNVSSKNLTLEESKPLKEVSGSYTYFADGDVLLAKITPCFENGKVGIASGLVNGVGFGSSEFVVFRSKGDVLPDYLFYYISQASFRDEGKRAMSGAVGHKRVSKEFIEGYQLPLPPLPEQERIVAILDQAFEGIDQAIAHTEQNLASARELFESYLNTIFTQQGEGWEEKKLGDVCDFSAGFAFKSNGYTTSEDGVKLLRGDNIIQGELRWKGVKKWPKPEFDNYSKFALKENDVVLAMDRPWVSAGLKIAHISSEDLPILQVQRTARLRCNSTSMWQYIYHLLQSRDFIGYILSGQTGLGVPHISGKQILNYVFNEPPKPVQVEIIQKLEMVSRRTRQLEALYTQKLESLKELKQSLLQQAFAGELTKDAAA